MAVLLVGPHAGAGGAKMTCVLYSSRLWLVRACSRDVSRRSLSTAPACGSRDLRQMSSGRTAPVLTAWSPCRRAWRLLLAQTSARAGRAQNQLTLRCCSHVSDGKV